MNANAALAWADALIFDHVGAHLTGLQTTILHLALNKQRYCDIANQYGCTEGHAKDKGAELWKCLSQALGEKVTKANFKTVFERHQSMHDHSLPSDEGKLSWPYELDATGAVSNFVGREEAIAHLNTLVARGQNAIVIQGEGGIGKTTLAQRYLQAQGFDLVLELLMAKETEALTPVEGVVEEWLKRDFNEEPGRAFGVTLARLKRHLKTQRIGVLIDNLEPALNRAGCLIDSQRNFVELLRVLTDPRNQSMTLITSRDRLCEDGVTVEHYRLPGLPSLAWQQFLDQHHIDYDGPTIQAVNKIYGGNAKAMQILCSVIGEDFDGDMRAYWQENCHDPLQSMALKNLVTGQMSRLQDLDPNAYRLLCRLGCYRFQDIATVPKAGLVALLWDVDPGIQPQVIQSLRNRSLLEFHRGQYWLHPVIKAEAIAQLRQTPDWEMASRCAAQFWTQSVSTIATLTDALSAWEAYYHYADIPDFEAASHVILQSRHNQWQQFLPLGSLLSRMGLLNPVLSAIQPIIDHVQSEAQRSELSNILGDLYWTTGDIHQAIAFQEKSLQTARCCLKAFPLVQTDSDGSNDQKPDHHQQYYLKMLEIDSLLSLGLYNIDLWELNAAEQQLEQVITLGRNTNHHRWAEKASVGLALVKSNLGQRGKAKALAEDIFRLVVAEQSSQYMGRFAYFIQLLGHTYTNLGELDRALMLYERAIEFADHGHYLQIKANAFSGVATINRLQGNLSDAIALHHECIQILEDIGARADLAQAYYQFSQTMTQSEQFDLARAHLSQASQIFSTMGALRQIERIGELSDRPVL